MMTNTRQQVAMMERQIAGPMETSLAISPATLSASILIVTGVVFQAIQIAAAHLAGTGLWFFSVLASNIWNMLALKFNAPAGQDLLQYWPLLLIGAGLAMLLAKQQSRRSGRFARRSGVRYGE